MNILVTGHLGFIGTHLVKKLEELGDRVWGLDLKEGNDILDCYLPAADVVIHLAAISEVLASMENPVETVRTNVLGTTRLLARYKNSKFIFASTGGAIQDEILSPYGWSKYSCEGFIKMLHTNYCILRFANVYGGPKSHSVIEKFINEPITIFGDGSATRTYVHVDDLVRGIIASMEWPVGLYMFGTTQHYTVQQIADATGKPFKYIDWKPGELRHSRVENTAPGWKETIDAIDYIKKQIK